MVSLPLVRRMEAVSFRAWPAASVHYDGSWAVRLTASHPSRRLNSVNPLDPADYVDIDKRVARAAKRFQSYDRPLVFRLSPLAPAPLEMHFDALGWQRAGESVVMLGEFEEMDIDGGFDLVPLKDINRYVNSSIRISGEEPEHKPGLTEVIEAIRPPHGMFVLEDANGPVAACLCVHDNDLAGLFDLSVRPDAQGRGYGRAIVRGALRWAASQGATKAWLQVEIDNKRALQLYNRMGFEEVYNYVYRIGNNL
ncbi:MAG: GNAT family N-acetyltransferase [Pseudomonadota bacterium]